MTTTTPTDLADLANAWRTAAEPLTSAADDDGQDAERELCDAMAEVLRDCARQLDVAMGVPTSDADLPDGLVAVEWDGTYDGVCIAEQTDPWLQRGGKQIDLTGPEHPNGPGPCGEFGHLIPGVSNFNDAFGIERCDDCGLHEGDLDAARAYAATLGPDVTVWYAVDPAEDADGSDWDEIDTGIVETWPNHYRDRATWTTGVPVWCPWSNTRYAGGVKLCPDGCPDSMPTGTDS